MARAMAEAEQLSVNGWGVTIGQALGEGIAAGIRSATSQASREVLPLVNEIVELLRREALAARAAAPQVTLAAGYISSEADEQLAALARAETAAHACEEAGCTEPALARSLCRRHYSRQLYQERKERVGAHGFRLVQPSTQIVFGGGNAVPEKKPVVAVAPIIRRKRNEATETAAPAAPAFKLIPQSHVPEADSPMAAAAAASGVTVAGIARFFGIGKD
jgi:hypothetical protein